METIRLDLEKRRGKTVTVLKGFTRQPDYLWELAREIKASCGTGGTVRENSIEIQGDFRQNLQAFLSRLGFSTKGI